VSPEWLLFEEGPMFPWPAVNQLLKDHFVRFEAHEQERREGYEDEDLGLDTPRPGKTYWSSSAGSTTGLGRRAWGCHNG